MDWRNHIHSDPKVLLGKPVIKGTRISVDLLLELMGNGWTKEMILDSYPTISEDSLKAVFFYLRDTVNQERYLPLFA